MGAMTLERITELLESLEGLEYPNRVAPAEEAVRMADRLGDEKLAWKARFALLTAAVFGGEPDKALVTFAWLEGKSSQDPERFPASRAVLGLFLSETDLLWGYKWVGLNLPDFVEISRQDIEAVLQRMRVQYEHHHVSLRPYWAVQARTHRSLGDEPSNIHDAVTEFNASPRDAYADCVACEWNFRVEMALLEGDVERALGLADRLVDGNHSCAEVPHITFSTLVVPTWKAGLHDRARVFHQRGYEMCRDNKDFLVPICEHIDFRLIEGDWPGAHAMLQRHALWARDTRASWRRLRFLQTALAVARHAPDDAVLTLPSEFQPAGAGPKPSMDDWRTQLEADITALAARFDLRNGNTAISDEAQAHLRNIDESI
jgi:hypothetical protein